MRIRLLAWLLALGLVGQQGLAAQGAAGESVDRPVAGQAPAAGSRLPVSLERIRRELQRPHVVSEGLARAPRGPLFSVRVEGKLPDFTEFVGLGALRRGPAPPQSVTHREFLELFTPREAQPFGAFEPAELVQAVATSAVFAVVTNYLARAIPSAMKARHEAKAREEVAAVLAVLAAREPAANPRKP